jgi:hypothetical protein
MALIATWALGEIVGMSIEPQLNLCTLQIGEQVLKSTEVSNPWKMTYRVGTNRFVLADEAVQRLSAAGNTAGWTARLDSGSHLQWLTADKSTAYLIAYTTDKNGRFQEYERPPRLRRLDLDSGKWLSDLPVTDNAPNGFCPQKCHGGADRQRWSPGSNSLHERRI